MGKRRHKAPDARYLLTTETLHPNDARKTDIAEYRKRHGGIGFDEVFDLRHALAAFLLPRLSILFREIGDMDVEQVKDDGSQERLHWQWDALKAKVALKRIIDGRGIGEDEKRMLVRILEDIVWEE